MDNFAIGERSHRNKPEQGLASILDGRETRPAVISVRFDADGYRRRPDGSLVLGLTSSEWESYVTKYSNLSREELTRIRDSINRPHFQKDIFDALAGNSNHQKGHENRYGKPASVATSLFMLLSVHVEPKPPRNSSYGEITSAEGFHFEKNYIYRTQVGKFDDGNLILNGPSQPCSPYDACLTLQSRNLSMTLYDQQGKRLYPLDDDDDDDDPIILDYSPDEFEHVTHTTVGNSEASITLNYISIPIGVCGCLNLRIFNKIFSANEPQQMVKVYGRVFATYENTFGNYNSEEIVLFDKDFDLGQYVTLNLNEKHNLLSYGRCWVAAPVFSLLQLHIRLYNFDSKESILVQDVELGTHDSSESCKQLFTDGFLISVSASWFVPSEPPGEFVDDDDEDDQISEILEPCAPPPSQSAVPQSHPAIEVFSLLICHMEECAELQVHGHLQFTSGWAINFKEGGIDIFRERAEYPLRLHRRSNLITPSFNGSRLHEYVNSVSVICDMSMICDMRDPPSTFSIKGYQYCADHDSFLNIDAYCERQMCSIFQCDRGFAALHWSIFSSALQASLKFTCKQKKSEGVNALTVSGRLYAQYADRDYSSQYKKDYCRIALFKREDLVEMDVRGSIPLSKSSFVVPSYSSLMFDVDLMIGTQKLLRKIKVPFGTYGGIIPNEEFEIRFLIEWSEV